MKLDVEKTIREYLRDIIHMSLGTSVEGKPWVCEVHFSEDDELNLYFRSRPATRHCQEISKNSNIAGNIVTQHVAGQKPRGVYFEGTAELLEDVKEGDAAYVAVCKKQSMGPEILEMQNEPANVKFYKITVSDFYVFDARESSPPQKYHLPWKK